MVMRLVREIRAISPLIATIILIAITVAGGLIVYALVNSSMFTQSAQAMARPEAVWLMSSPSGRHFIVNLKNVGNKPITQVNVTVLGEETASFDVSIPPGSTKFFHISLNGSYIVGERYGALVEGKCSDGSTFALQLTATCEGVSYPGGPSGGSSGGSVTNVYQNITAYGGYEGDYVNWVKAWTWDFAGDPPSGYSLPYVWATFAKDYLLVVYKDSSGNYRLASLALSNGTTLYLSPSGYFYTEWVNDIGYHLYNTLVTLSESVWADQSGTGMSFSVRGRYVLLAALGTCSKLVIIKDGVQFWESPAASDVDPDASFYYMAGLSWSGKYVVALTDTGKLVCFKGIGTDPEEPRTTTPLEGDYSVYTKQWQRLVKDWESELGIDGYAAMMIEYNETADRLLMWDEDIGERVIVKLSDGELIDAASVRSNTGCGPTGSKSLTLYFAEIIDTGTTYNLQIYKGTLLIQTIDLCASLGISYRGGWFFCLAFSTDGKYLVVSGPNPYGMERGMPNPPPCYIALFKGS